MITNHTDKSSSKEIHFFDVDNDETTNFSLPKTIVLIKAATQHYIEHDIVNRQIS